jgi:hypothetical protein
MLLENLLHEEVYELEYHDIEIKMPILTHFNVLQKY